jgi:hypothetical protein
MRLRHITPSELKSALADLEIRWPDHFGRTVIRTHVRARLLLIAYEMHRETCVVVPVVAPEEEPDAA